MRVFGLMLLFSFSSYAADDFKPTAASDHLNVIGQCLFTVHNPQHVHRENNFLEHRALYALFSAWYKKNSANQKGICIDGSEVRRAFQQFLNPPQLVGNGRLYRCQCQYY